MTLVKCPRCELNYILDGGTLCTVCRREVRGEQIDDDMPEMCSECGENPVVSGSEFCAQCLKEILRRNAASPAQTDDTITVEDATLGMDNVSGMDEIVIDDMDDTNPPFAADDEDEDKDDDEDEGANGKLVKVADDPLDEMEEPFPDDLDDDEALDDEDDDLLDS